MKRGRGKDIYHSDNFKPDARERAKGKIDEWLEWLKTQLSSFGALNVNTDAFKDSPEGSPRDAVECLQAHTFKWFFSFVSLDIIVYMFQKNAWGWPVFIFLHKPPCYMDMSTISML